MKNKLIEIGTGTSKSIISLKIFLIRALTLVNDLLPWHITAKIDMEGNYNRIYKSLNHVYDKIYKLFWTIRTTITDR